MKPALACGDLTCIGITTQEEYTRFIEKDQALVRRFHPIIIAEPTPHETLEILSQLASAFAAR